jgi:Na+-translocating ferredoxin:NAD+ oxidoreductase RnfD subunit
MKLTQLPVLFFTALMIVIAVVESTFALPVVALLLLLMQQSLLSEVESVILALLLGMVISAMYSLPFVLGMSVVAIITLIARRHIWKSHAQTRDGLLVLIGVIVIGLSFHPRPGLFEIGGVAAYYSVVILISRLWKRH